MKKIHEWEFWDWPSIWRALLLLGGGTLLFFFLFNRSHYELGWVQKDMTERTTGIVYRKFIEEGQMQSITGTRGTVNGVTILFNYSVEGKEYIHQQTLSFSVMDGQELNRIYSSKLPITIKVKYNKYNPYKASVDLN